MMVAIILILLDLVQDNQEEAGMELDGGKKEERRHQGANDTELQRLLQQLPFEEAVVCLPDAVLMDSGIAHSLNLRDLRLI